MTEPTFDPDTSRGNPYYFEVPVEGPIGLAPLNALTRVLAAAWPGSMASTENGLLSLLIPREQMLREVPPLDVEAIARAAEAKVSADDIEAQVEVEILSEDRAEITPPEETLGALAAYCLALVERLPDGVIGIDQHVSIPGSGQTFRLSIEPLAAPVGDVSAALSGGRWVVQERTVQADNARLRSEVSLLHAELNIVHESKARMESVLRKMSVLKNLSVATRNSVRDALR